MPNCRVRAAGSERLFGEVHEHAVTNDANGELKLAGDEDIEKALYVHLPVATSTNPFPALVLRAMRPTHLTRIVVTESAQHVGRIRGRVSPPLVDANSALRIHSSGTTVPVPIQADGGFVVDHLPSGNYRLFLHITRRAVPWSHTLRRVPLAPGEEVDLGTLADPNLVEVQLELDRSSAAAPVTCAVRDAANDLVGNITLQPGDEVIPCCPRVPTPAATRRRPVRRSSTRSKWHWPQACEFSAPRCRAKPAYSVACASPRRRPPPPTTRFRQPSRAARANPRARSCCAATRKADVSPPSWIYSREPTR
jgi:hypothetical protein